MRESTGTSPSKPAFLDDGGEHEVQDFLDAMAEAVREFFSGAKEQYDQMGVKDTHAEIQMLDWLTDRIALVEVRWPWRQPSSSVTGW